MPLRRLLVLVCLLIAVTSCVRAAHRRAQGDGAVVAWKDADTWAFDPPADTFDAASVLDLRYLNEKVAGESGFVRTSPDGADLLLGNGKPARFWAVNSGVRERDDRPGALAEHARFLAKRGVNMVRFHGNITPGGGALTDINADERDRLWRLVAAMKKEGIYVTASLYWAASSRTKPSMGTLDTGGEAGNHGLLFFDPKLQAAYREWWRKVLAEPNPYTGVPLAKDPALAILQLQNEDSLFFWTSQGIKGSAGEELRRRFGAFLKAKHGSVAAALQAYGDARLPEDNPGRGEAGLYIVWELTQDRGSDGQKRRCADQTEFMARIMRDFNADMARYLRQDLGARQIVNAGNWRTADDVKLLDANRWTDAAVEVLASNRYVTGIHQGPNEGWAIVNGDRFTDVSVLLRPRDLPVSLKQVIGKPMMVTESSWVPPLSYQSEGPFLVAAYQSLSGVDAYYWFATGERQWRKPGSANGYLPSEGKWVCATPMLMGQWPAAALLYRQGYVKKADPIVVENRALEDLWRRRTPLIAEDPGFDPNRDRGAAAPRSNIKTGVDPLAFLIGPVVAAYDADPATSRVGPVASHIDEATRTVRSLTGQLVWDYGVGVCTLDAPSAQGAVGFLGKRGAIQLTDVAIRSKDDYASVLVVSMDAKPLARSSRVLVQVGTRQRPTNWKERPAEITVNGKKAPGLEVVDFGTAPWRILRARTEITLANPAITRARVLDANGMPIGERTLTRSASGVTFSFPPDALYVVLD